MPIPVRMTPNNDTYLYQATTLFVFWPRAEHKELLARWPHLTAEVGATWDEPFCATGKYASRRQRTCTCGPSRTNRPTSVLVGSA